MYNYPQNVLFFIFFTLNMKLCVSIIYCHYSNYQSGCKKWFYALDFHASIQTKIFFAWLIHFYVVWLVHAMVSKSQPVKLDLNKKSLPKQKTNQNFTIDAQEFRKTKNKILPRGKWELPANQCRLIYQQWTDRPVLVRW